MGIADRMLSAQEYGFDAAARRVFQEYLERRMTQPHFANARSVRNAIDRAKLRQANRLVKQGGVVERQELARIDADDIRQSRVFDDADGRGRAGAAGEAGNPVVPARPRPSTPER